MERSDTIIRVRSEKQAMDWSLVLVSQGIETAIDRAPEDGQWFLLIDPADVSRAVAALKQYERENRRRRWQQPVRWTRLLFDWRVVFCLLPLLAFFLLSDVVGLNLKSAGVMDLQAVRRGEWWRLFTAVTLHADAGHLASNLATGLVLLGLAMGSYGAGQALLASYLAGVGGNLAGLLLLEAPRRSLGASGMMLGALGLLTAHSLKLWRAGETYRRLMGRAIVAGCLLLVLLGLNPQTDVLAHVGGFATGALLGMVLVFLPEKWTHSLAVDRTAGVLCLALVLVAWWRALAFAPAAAMPAP
jgi:rhomboid protease GluP